MRWEVIATERVGAEDAIVVAVVGADDGVAVGASVEEVVSPL